MLNSIDNGDSVTLKVPGSGGNIPLTFKVKGSGMDHSVMEMIRKGNGCYEPDLMDFLRDILRPDSIVLDLGANIGVMALALGVFCPSGKIYAFEPGLISFGYLVDNIRASGLDNIEACNLAVSDRNGALDFSYTESFTGGSFVSDRVFEGKREKVKAVKLDDWINARGIAKLDLLKIDVEGSELKAVNGAEETLIRFRPDLIVECNFHTLKRFQGDSPDGLFNRLAGLYPRIYSLGDKQRIRSTGQLWNLIEENNVVNLFCTFQPLPTSWRTLVKIKCPWLKSIYRYIRYHEPLSSVYRKRFIIRPGCEIRVNSNPATVSAGTSFLLDVTIRNTSEYIYSSADREYPVNATYQWLDENRDILVFDGIRTPLPEDIHPGGSAMVAAKIISPEIPGRYLLRLSLVQEQVHWFYQADRRLDYLLPMEVR